jgi:hypothetical protein
MMTPRECSMPVEKVLDAYAPPLGKSDYRLPDVLTHLMAYKFTRGGEDVDGTLDLTDLLTEPWPTDAHFVMYTSPSNTRLVKGGATTGIRFEIAVVDLDFDEHRTLPTLEDFCKLMIVVDINPYKPNVIYSTRRGARFVYLIEPIEDAELFESAYQAFLLKLKKPFDRREHFYRVDTAAKDWTRLFRAPRVVRDDKEEFHHQVRLLHSDRLHLDTPRRKTRAPRKRQQVPSTRAMAKGLYRGNDPAITRALADIREGSRNAALFRLAARASSKYHPGSRDLLLDMGRRKAISEGLPEDEVEQVITSAMRRASHE